MQHVLLDAENFQLSVLQPALKTTWADFGPISIRR